ncbi:MAG: HoxN/HupN/NixA family nickel/cobalt transporter [Alphaproteobacteria bacterium]|nr:HoxN/HupN/NixA family nickel/cobalt transporter [Alphaproteobacteria bacterium]MDE2112601.1 HoxN/HupN/NixA family nickel/cobalt transporter [Alphaproteobacteria bacterium]MDE2494086.1 HoxN/HupN/NixA family nickel/cobalt transporter [Alphaproteobacteria bacterium]
MGRTLHRIFNEGAGELRFKIGGLYALVIAGNVAAWLWALTAFRDYPILLGTALLAYGLGLRHAVDADHIASIDNVTRKLMQDGKRPAAVGFFFSLGHSTIVVLASLAIAVTATAFKAQFSAMRDIGGFIGTLTSAAFLLAIALMNLAILVTIFRTFQRVKAGAPYVAEDLDMLLAGRGFLARLLRPLFRMIRSSWQMYPLGFLFGLGFDTATEVGLLGISATQSAHGMMLWSIMVFPALFAAGMALVDTTDSILMLGAYGWAFLKPLRKLYYNMSITFVSVVVAFLIGGVEALGLIGAKFELHGPFWQSVGTLNGSFGTLGYLIIAIFVFSWIGSAAIYRLLGYDRIEISRSR